jgi:cytochrome d ubiquinol oxidase subunit II
MPDWFNLNTIWFGIIAFLWLGYFFLEGFDFGVGTLLPIVGRSEEDRRAVYHSIHPFWDGNEVWLIVAGGATFAAFPEWYATLFSGFYLALFVILVALIGRGVAIEYRSKRDDPRWHATWDRVMVIGSAVPAFLWGVAFANFIQGVPIDSRHEFTGTLLDLLSPYALFGGIMSLGLFALHGANFLSLRTEGELRDRAGRLAERLSWPIVGIVFLFLAWTYINAQRTGNTGIVPGIIPVSALAAAAFLPFLTRGRRVAGAFVASSATILLVFLTIFLNLYPRVLVSSTSPQNSLTIFNASSSHTTLLVMTIVAAIFTPVVLAYEAWSYWVFRGRLTSAQFQLPSFLRR